MQLAVRHAEVWPDLDDCRVRPVPHDAHPSISELQRLLARRLDGGCLQNESASHEIGYLDVHDRGVCHRSAAVMRHDATP